MQINNLNNKDYNYSISKSFKGKHINEQSFVESSKNIRKAVRMLSIPKKGEVLSDLDKISLDKDIYISGYPKQSRQNGFLSLLVVKGNKDKADYYFDAKGYSNASSLKDSILDAIKRLSSAF